MAIEVVFCLGSNFGDRFHSVDNARKWLMSKLSHAISSPIYQTEPVGKKDSGNYMNAVVAGNVVDDIHLMVKLCKDYEINCGRTEEARLKGEVPIDIDMVIVNGEIIKKWDFSQAFFQKGYISLLKQAPK